MTVQQLLNQIESDKLTGAITLSDGADFVVQIVSVNADDNDVFIMTSVDYTGYTVKQLECDLQALLASGEIHAESHLPVHFGVARGFMGAVVSAEDVDGEVLFSVE